MALSVVVEARWSPLASGGTIDGVYASLLSRGWANPYLKAFIFKVDPLSSDGGGDVDLDKDALMSLITGIIEDRQTRLAEMVPPRSYNKYKVHEDEVMNGKSLQNCA